MYCCSMHKSMSEITTFHVVDRRVASDVRRLIILKKSEPPHVGCYNLTGIFFFARNCFTSLTV
jgi:hypothetical protein